MERPFGELLFARAVVIGDGATERAFLPLVLREAIGPLAHGVSIVDSAGMNPDIVRAVIKFARHVGIPLVVFADNDVAGKQAVKSLIGAGTLKESAEVVWSGLEDEKGTELGGAIERMMIHADREACVAACRSLSVSVGPEGDLLNAMKGLKGTIGGPLAHEFVMRHPYSSNTGWPEPLKQLVELLRAELGTVMVNNEALT